jgi:sulfopyruvate decarboxylase TPP-binding subunit
MIKAKDFWTHLCDTVGVRFFSGVPSEGNAALYKTMSKDFMFYIPAVNERVALGLVNGARLSGEQSGLLLGSPLVQKLIFDIENFNLRFNIPILIITDSEADLSSCKIPTYQIDEDNLEDIKGSGVFVVKEGFK